MILAMVSSTKQDELFPQLSSAEDGTTLINERCRVETQDGYRVVSVCGLVLAHYPIGDRIGEAHAMVSLVDQGWARQTEIARAFNCDERTVRRHQRRFESGGLAALGRPRGYPKGQPRVPKTRTQKVNKWKTEGVSNREIARRLGVNEKAVRKLARRLGWKDKRAEQIPLPNVEGADPKLSASTAALPDEPQMIARGSVAEPKLAGLPVEEPGLDADPKLSASGTSESDRVPLSLDPDPSDRSIDRVMACLGLLDDAAPVFRPGTQVPGAGVLLAVPALVESGVLNVARDIYGSLGPAFYGLRTTVVALLLMALLRIKRAEALKEHAPQQLGRLLGLDRAPEVKTLRRKLTRLAGYGRAAAFGRALAERRVATRGHAIGFLYVDGHVRAYHGKRRIPKTHVARIRSSMPASTDYWVNDAEGEPLFVIPTEANKGLVKMLPVVLDEVRGLVGERRVTVVFDRGGWSPKLFKELINDGSDILTYRKGRFRRVPKSRFSLCEATIAGRKVRYVLADQGILLLKRTLRLRQVTRLTNDGHQTPIITSRRDLSAVEIAYRMFERWRQENFFKYLREEFALDALVDYGVDSADPKRDVPNPVRKKLDAELRKARVELEQLEAEYGLEAFENRERLRRTMRGFKIANAELGQKVLDAMRRVTQLENKRATVPARVPIQKVVEGDVIKLSVERKHLTDILKMVAYQAEGDLVRLLSSHYHRTEDEGRTFIQNALAGSGDIEVNTTRLLVSLDPLSSPHRTRALAGICDELSAIGTCFPGTKLQLQFAVKPEPPRSTGFPGPKPASRTTARG